MEKKNVYRDRTAIREAKTFIADAATSLNNISNHLVALEVKSPTVNEMIDLINKHFKKPNSETVTQWLKETKAGRIENPEINGLPIDRKKLIDLIEIKGDVQPLTQAIWNANYLSQNIGLVKSCLIANKSGVIEPIQNYTVIIEKRYTSTTNNPLQNEVLNHINTLVSSIKAIEKIASERGCELGLQVESPLRELPYIKITENLEIVPNEGFIAFF